jgi:signal transduction histidine kinase
MMGAVRLTSEPFTWASYTVDLREHYNALAAEQKARELQAKNELINQIAHELNNPLAALTFLLSLLSTRPDIVTGESRSLLRQASEQLDRIAQAVREMLAASQGQ